jgi:hypothetical protein
MTARYRSRRESGSARHIGGLAQRVPLHTLSAGTWRHPASWGRARAQQRLPVELRQQLLDAIYDGEPFGQALRDLDLTPNQVWGLAQTDHEWSEKLEAALTAARRDDLQHGTTAAYVHGCVCSECRNISASGWRRPTDGISWRWHTRRVSEPVYKVLVANEDRSVFSFGWRIWAYSTSF